MQVQYQASSNAFLGLKQNQKSVWSSSSNRNKYKPFGENFLAEHEKKYKKARVAWEIVMHGGDAG